jgi:hypothetical protein
MLRFKLIHYWRVADWLDYQVMNIRLRIIDGLCGSEPETEADWERDDLGTNRSSS